MKKINLFLIPLFTFLLASCNVKGPFNSETESGSGNNSLTESESESGSIEPEQPIY